MDRMSGLIKIHLFDGPDTTIKAVRNLSFDGITAHGRSGVMIAGTPSVPIENVSFSNCSFTVDSPTEAMKLSKTKNVTFHGVNLSVNE